jgi:hypothetical protein
MKVPDKWTKGPVVAGKGRYDPRHFAESAIPDIVAAGGAVGGDINALRRCFDPKTLAPSVRSNDVRLDVVNRGHNLKRE